MSLKHLVDNSLTDKQRSHGYLDLYEKLLNKKQLTSKYVLEVGIGDFNLKNGGSIKLWYDYFKNATIFGLDILSIDRVIDELINNDRIKLFTSVDAYDKIFFDNNILNLNIKFDFLLDDGPHTLDSIIKFVKLYSQILADDGILIIEDIQKIEYIDYLKECVPDNLKPYIKVYDLRDISPCCDNIVFTIDKTQLI
jgi:hypothetical protein